MKVNIESTCQGKDSTDERWPRRTAGASDESPVVEQVQQCYARRKLLKMCLEGTVFLKLGKIKIVVTDYIFLSFKVTTKGTEMADAVHEDPLSARTQLCRAGVVFSCFIPNCSTLMAPQPPRIELVHLRARVIDDIILDAKYSMYLLITPHVIGNRPPES